MSKQDISTQSAMRIAMAHTMDALDWQERNFPSEAVMVKTGYTESKEGQPRRVLMQKCRRRIQDARMFDAIEEVNGDRAAMWINIAVTYITNPVRVKTMDLTRLEPKEGSLVDPSAREDFLADVTHHYRAWCSLCHDYRINVDGVLDLLCRNISMSAVDKEYRKRHGWSRKNLMDGLEQYNKMMKWS